MIQNSAIVSPNSKLGKNVKIGPNVIIEDDVIIGDNTEIMANVVIAEGTSIGNDCSIFYNAIIGTAPQDLKYNGEKTKTVIGNRTVIREFATINRGTVATKQTVIGNDTLIMAYCHVAHDSVVGDNVVIANVTQLAGHTVIGDWAILGGVVKVNQFCNIGKHSMIGADIKVTKDILPFSLVGKTPAQVEGINKIGLKRRGFSKDTINEIKVFFDNLLFSGMNNQQALEKYSKLNNCQDVIDCINFINNSEKGILR